MLKFYVQGIKENSWTSANPWQQELIKSSQIGAYIKHKKDIFALFPNCSLNDLSYGILPPYKEYKNDAIDTYVDLLNHNLMILKSIVSKPVVKRPLDPSDPSGTLKDLKDLTDLKVIKALPDEMSLALDDWETINEIAPVKSSEPIELNPPDYLDTIIGKIFSLNRSIEEISAPSITNYYMITIELINEIKRITTNPIVHNCLIDSLRVITLIDNITFQFENLSGYIVNLTSGKISMYIATQISEKNINKYFPWEKVPKLTSEQLTFLKESH